MYIYSVFVFHSCPLLIPLCNIATLSLIDVVFESTLLNYANPCQNCTIQRFARVAEKKERNEINERSDTRQDLNPGPRLVAPMLYPLSYGASGQNPNFNPYKLSNLKFIPLPLIELLYYIVESSVDSNKKTTLLTTCR